MGSSRSHAPRFGAMMGPVHDAQSTFVAGYKLDRYELLSPIASGGMASVWLARLRGKRGFEKLFAIKTIKGELTEDSRFQEMFLDEARIASGIQHPNVAQILDLGEQDNALYIVMEWVDGDSLAKIRRLAKKAGAPLPLGVSLRIMADACAGLHAAHELRDRQGKNLGVVHRDVSPQNILVTGSGSVKVIDFGVAKARDRFAGDTGTGIVKGKIRYMPPEQAQGHAMDRRADIWAIGVCLYELVTGELPFDNDSDIDVLRRLMSDEPAPRAQGDVPEPIREILAHSLVRECDERFATAIAMERAIELAMDALGLTATNEDVAEFLRAHLPDLEARRHEAVQKALAGSEAREEKSKVSPATADDPAFAPTVVSERKVEGGAVEAKASATAVKKKAPPPAKKKKPRPQTPEPLAQESEAKETSTAVAMMRPSTPGKRRGTAWWLVALGAAGACAWFVWPGGDKLRAMLAQQVGDIAPATTPAAEATAASTASAQTSATEAPSASAVASAPAAASASPSASASAVASASASATPEASSAPAASASAPGAAEPAIAAGRPPATVARPAPRPRPAEPPAPAPTPGIVIPAEEPGPYE